VSRKSRPARIPRFCHDRNVSDLTSPAFLLEAPDLLQDILDLPLDLPNFVRDLLRTLAVAVLPGFGQRGVQLSQLLMEPGQLVTKLSELPAILVVRPLAGIADLRGLPAASGLSGSRLLRRDVRGHHTHEGQREE
jgi:hypothetical protein